MAHELIVTWLFRCINFSVIVWLFCYVVIRYFLPSIARARQSQIDIHDECVQEYQNLLDQKRVMYAAMEKDQKLCEALKRKILVWKTGVLKQQQDREKYQLVLQERVQKRVDEQAQARNHMRVMHAVVPEILDRTRTVLIERYRNDAVGREYLQEVLHHIKGRL